MLLTSKITQSIIDSFITVSGESVAEHPKINKILKILEPIALPKAKPLSPFFVATIEVTSSGREVPIATIVSPMKQYNRYTKSDPYFSSSLSSS